MNRERFIKPKYDKYIQLYSKKANCEDATQALVLTGILIDNAGQNYPDTGLTATISAPPSGGTAATATPTVSNGKITSIAFSAGSGYTSVPQITLNVSPTTSVKAIEIVDRGLGYTSPPRIFIDYPPNLRKAVIEASFNYVGESNGVILQTLTIIDGGAGYITAPNIYISGPNHEIDDTPANVELTILNGSVNGFNILSRGSYSYAGTTYANVSNPPLTNVAAATCTIDEEGSINSITITNQGSGYTSTPNVVLEQTSYTERAELKAHRTVGFNGALSINSKYQPSQVFKYTWDLDTPITINENAILQIVERQFLNIPSGDVNKLISIKIHDIGTQSIVNTRNTGINTDFNGGILLDIGKPDRVLPNDIKLEINQQVITRITLSLNHDITNTAGFNYNTEFVVVMKVSEKEPSLIEYGALNNINFLQ